MDMLLMPDVIALSAPVSHAVNSAMVVAFRVGVGCTRTESGEAVSGAMQRVVHIPEARGVNSRQHHHSVVRAHRFFGFA
jgi:hypothetical protein